MKRVRYLVEATLFHMLIVAARVVPRRALLTVGGWLGEIAFHADRRHRRVTLDNLRLAYAGELSLRQQWRLARRCWHQFGRVVLDALSFPRFGLDAIGSVVRYEGLEHIRGAYARGKGVLLFSGHFGNWELTALMQGYLRLPLHLVVRPLDNPALERELARLRCSSGNWIIHKRRAVREMVKALRAGDGVAIVIDQDAHDGGLFVPFFGRPASTTPTLARLALRTGAVVVPTFCVPEAGGSYRVIYEPPVTIDPRNFWSPNPPFGQSN